MKKHIWIFALIICMSIGLSGQAFSMYMTGGDAANQADANVILDIVFASDTSGSMYDEIDTLSATMQGIITNLDCPDCDVWVRASLMGLTGTRAAFNQTVRNYVFAQGGSPVTNHSEDNGPAVTDLARWYNWNDDSTADQDYYKAIVSIGDEGTENGHPIYQSDWDAAFLANTESIANDIMVFSLIGTPYYSNSGPRDAVFTAMAEGGTGGGHVFGDTNGLAIHTTSNSLESDIEDIICTAATGGDTGPVVPEPSTMLLLGVGIAGVFGFRKKFNK